MAVKKSAEPEPAPEPEAAPPPEPKRDPLTAIGVDLTRSGTYVYQAPPAGWAFQRTLIISNRRVEHVATETDGVWCFRWQ